MSSKELNIAVYEALIRDLGEKYCGISVADSMPVESVAYYLDRKFTEMKADLQSISDMAKRSL